MVDSYIHLDMYMSSGMVRTSNLVVEAQLCGFNQSSRFKTETIGHLHNRVILLMGLESFRVLLSCAN